MSDLDPLGQPADPNWHGQAPPQSNVPDDFANAMSDMAKTLDRREFLSKQTPERIGQRIQAALEGLSWVEEAELMPDSEPVTIDITTTDQYHFFVEVHPR